MSSLDCLTVLMKLLRGILESSEVFNYAQYFHVITEIPLFNMDMKKSCNTLELFSYGSISDYVFHSDKYLKLTPAAVAKLRILTLVTLADIYDELDLNFLCVQLRTGSKREGLNVLLKACQAGAITSAVDFHNEKVQFFSVRKRNTDIMLVERLVNAKDAILNMFANRSIIFVLPLKCAFSDIVQRLVVSAARQEQDFMCAETELSEFLNGNVKNQIKVVDNKNFFIECGDVTDLDENKQENVNGNENEKEEAYDADEEIDKDDAKMQKKQKKKAK